MLKKKIIALSLLFTLCVGLTACTNNSTEVDNTESSISTEVGSTVSEMVENVDLNVPAEPVEGPEVLPMPEVDTETILIDSEMVEGTEIIGDDEFILEEDMFTDELIESAVTSVKDTLKEDYYPNMFITADLVEGIYGLTPDMYDSYFGEMPMISVNVDFLMAVKAKEGMVETVQEKLTAYVDGLKNDMMQYPMNKAALPAATVVTHGNYVFAVATFGNTAGVAEYGDEAILDYATVNVTKALEAIDKAFLYVE